MGIGAEVATVDGLEAFDVCDGQVCGARPEGGEVDGGCRGVDEEASADGVEVVDERAAEQLQR